MLCCQHARDRQGFPFALLTFLVFPFPPLPPGPTPTTSVTGTTVESILQKLETTDTVWPSVWPRPHGLSFVVGLFQVFACGGCLARLASSRPPTTSSLEFVLLVKMGISCSYQAIDCGSMYRQVVPKTSAASLWHWYPGTTDDVCHTRDPQIAVARSCIHSQGSLL